MDPIFSDSRIQMIIFSDSRIQMIIFSDSRDSIFNSRDPIRVSKTPLKKACIIYCTAKVTLFRNVLSRVYGTLCGPLEIPGWTTDGSLGPR